MESGDVTDTVGPGQHRPAERRRGAGGDARVGREGPCSPRREPSAFGSRSALPNPARRHAPNQCRARAATAEADADVKNKGIPVNVSVGALTDGALLTDRWGKCAEYAASCRAAYLRHAANDDALRGLQRRRRPRRPPPPKGLDRRSRQRFDRFNRFGTRPSYPKQSGACQ